MDLGPEGQQILLESNTLNVSAEVKQQVIEEFLRTSTDDGPALNRAQVEAFRPRGTTSDGRRRPLEFLRGVDTQQLMKMLRKEHPQTIALILKHLDRHQASSVLSELAPNQQAEVARRLADLGQVAPEIFHEVEKALELQLYAIVEGESGTIDGKEILLEILGRSDKSTEDKIISGLTVKSPHLAGDLKSKLCHFEDLNEIDDYSLQQVLRLTDVRDLCHALKGANRDLTDRIYRGMSAEAARALRGDVEVLPQPSWEEIKAAQQQIRNILRGLIALGKIKFN